MILIVGFVYLCSVMQTRRVKLNRPEEEGGGGCRFIMIKHVCKAIVFIRKPNVQSGIDEIRTCAFRYC